jgi:hypothetical protein
MRFQSSGCTRHDGQKCLGDGKALHAHGIEAKGLVGFSLAESVASAKARMWQLTMSLLFSSFFHFVL